MTRAALIARARLGFKQAGRGVVVKLVEDVEPRYVPVEEVKARLVGEEAETPVSFSACSTAAGWRRRRHSAARSEVVDPSAASVRVSWRGQQPKEKLPAEKEEKTRHEQLRTRHTVLVTSK